MVSTLIKLSASETLS